MGSGGLRGLQILRSGASRVRGGFDSHAFPPSWALIALLTLGLPLTVQAQTDSLATPGNIPARPDTILADSAAVVTPAPAVVREIGTPVQPMRTTPLAQRPRFDQPRWVMLRSLVLPGWGQAHNRAWIKASGVAIGELALIKAAVNDERALKDLDRAVAAAQQANDEAAFHLAVAAYNDRLAATTSRRWFLGALVAYSLLDAYVDAHFTTFDVEFGEDPALPGGRSTGKRARLGLRWWF